MYAGKWRKVLKVSTNHPTQKNIKATQITLSAEAVGKESFVIIATITQALYLGRLKSFALVMYHP